MNVNSHEFSGDNNNKNQPIPVPDPSKLKKSTMPLSLNSSEFKNHPEKEKIITNLNLPPETTVIKPQEKHIESLLNKKKMSMSKASKPFSLNDVAIQEPFVNNNVFGTAAIENPQQTAEPHMFFAPKINFSEMNSSSFPKLTNKKSLKNAIPTTNSSNELHTQQNESQYNKESDETKEKNKNIFMNNKENEAENKSLPPILEEPHKTKDEKKKNDSYFNLITPSHPQINKNDEFKTQKLKENDKEISKIAEHAKIDEILPKEIIIQKVEETLKKVEIASPKVERSTPIVEKTIPLTEPIIPKPETTIQIPETAIPELEKAEIIPKENYKEFMISIIQVFF